MPDDSTPAVHDRPGGAHCGLTRLVADAAALRERHWDWSPLLTRASELPSPADLFGSAAVDELLSLRGLRTPFLRMVKNGVPLPTSAYTLGGGVGAHIGDQISEDRVLALFADGASIVLQGLHRTWRPIIEQSQALAADLGHPVQVNAYITPPSSRGFDVHYDVHDVFVLQVEGSKRWELREPVLPHPLRDQPSTDRGDQVARSAAAEPWLATDLLPGDCLYLPRGWLHSATALGRTSIHLTFGVHVWTVADVLREATSAALSSVVAAEAARAALPVGVEVGDADQLRRLLKDWAPQLVAAIDGVSADDLAVALTARQRAAQRAEPLAPMHQLAAADEHRADGWRLRSHLAPSWSDGVLLTRVGRMPVPPADRSAVVAVLESGDPAHLHEALRRGLILAGILVPA